MQINLYLCIYLFLGEKPFWFYIIIMCQLVMLTGAILLLPVGILFPSHGYDVN